MLARDADTARRCGDGPMAGGNESECSGSGRPEPAEVWVGVIARACVAETKADRVSTPRGDSAPPAGFDRVAARLVRSPQTLERKRQIAMQTRE